MHSPVKHIQDPFNERQSLCGIPLANVRWSNFGCLLGTDCEKCLDKSQEAYNKLKLNENKSVSVDNNIL